MREERIFRARVPLRVDFAGGGTDCPPFSVEYGGAVVNAAVAYYVRAELEILDGPQLQIVSRDLDDQVEAGSLAELAIDGRLDLLKAAAKRMAPPSGFRLSMDSAMPPGTGLGSSGAAGAACVGIFDAAMGNDRSQLEAAELANSIEREDLGYAGGSQDSYGAALGGIKLITYHQGGGAAVRQLDLAAETLQELEARGLLVYTGEVHLSGGIHADIKASYDLPDSPTVDAMKNLARIGAACAETLETGDLRAFAALLNENWQHHQRLHPSCCSERLQAFYDAAAPFITGGKTCGAGGGGFVFFLAQPGRKAELEAACEAIGGKGYTFRIDSEGLVSKAEVR